MRDKVYILLIILTGLFVCDVSAQRLIEIRPIGEDSVDIKTIEKWQLPSIPGGEKKLSDFIKKNLVPETSCRSQNRGYSYCPV